MRSELFAYALVTLAAVGCSSGGGSSTDGAAGDGGMDTAPAPLSCLMIRNCVYLCPASDPTCPQGCVDRGTDAARATYNQVTSCSFAACPEGTLDCRCDQECYADGTCSHLVDECTQSLQEGFCVQCF